MSSENNKGSGDRAMLAEARACYNYLFYHASDAVIICSPEGAILDVNIGACDWLGYTREEFLQRTIMSLQYSNPASDYLDRIKEVFQYGTLSMESDLCNRTGMLLHVEIVAQAIEHAGQPALFNTIRDISNRKSTEQQMRQAVQYNRSLIDTIPDPVFIISSAGLVTDANESAVAMIGVELDRLVGSTFSTYFANPAAAATFYRQVLSGGGRRSIELRIRHMESGTIIMQCNASTFRQPGNADESVLIAGRDVTELVRVRSALERTERRSRKTLETSPEAIFVTDTDGHFIQANKNAAQLFGFHKIIELHKSGLTFFDLIAEPDRKRAREYLYRCLVSGKIRDVRYTSRRATGEEFPLEISSSLLMEADGDPMEFITVARDITERVAAERALRESEQRYKTLFEQAPIGIYRTTPEGKIVAGNPALLRILGFSSLGELLAVGMDGLGARDADARRAFRLRVDQQGGIGVHESIWRKGDGSFAYVREYSAAVKDAEGRTIHYEGTVEDVTAQVLAEKEQSRLIAILEATPDLVAITARNGDPIYLNAAARRMLGVEDYADLAGISLTRHYPPEKLQWFRRHGVTAAVRNGVWNGESVILRTDGTPIPVSQVLISHRNAVGRTEYFSTVVRDITELKKAEAEMRRALEKEQELNALKTRFVSMTSHEFRTPLTTIIASSDMLLRSAAKWSKEKKESHLKQILESGERMTDLLNDILILGRADAGKIRYNPAPLDVLQWCRNLVDELQLAAREGQYIRCDFPDAVPPAVVDEKLLRHILANLLSNAVKYSPKGTPVKFAITSDAESVVFRVSDAGIGIPEKDQEHLFELFHRAENVGSIQGTGLGLTIVKRSVDMSGGSISVESTVNTGTTFTVHIPLYPTGHAG
jgi:PAS domain S-box-containing protein